MSKMWIRESEAAREFAVGGPPIANDNECSICTANSEVVLRGDDFSVTVAATTRQQFPQRPLLPARSGVKFNGVPKEMGRR
jgi:hypothetical protein